MAGVARSDERSGEAGRRRKSLTTRAYETLRARIITGQMAPGLEVVEHELAEQLAVSKTPVREALARLGVEGLIETFPRRGYRVTPVTVKDMNDLFAVRAVLEGTAGALAAHNLDDAQLDALEALATARYVVGETVSVHAFVKANEDFHAGIARAAGNPRLCALVMRHLEECARFFYMGARVRDVNLETGSDHRRIVVALRGRDAEQARAAMIEHNENTRRGLLAALIANEGGELQL